MNKDSKFEHCNSENEKTLIFIVHNADDNDDNIVIL